MDRAQAGTATDLARAGTWNERGVEGGLSENESDDPSQPFAARTVARDLNRMILAGDRPSLENEGPGSGQGVTGLGGPKLHLRVSHPRG